MGTKKLIEVAEIRGRVGWKGYTKEDLCNQGPLVLGANDITMDNQLNLENVKHLTRSKYEESPEIMIKKNDILVVKVGSTIGKVAIVDQDLGEATINPNCVIVRAKNINPYYLYYFLISPVGQSFLINNSSASGQPALNQTDLGKLNIPIVDIKQQEYITKSLKMITKKINNNKELILNLDLYAKTCFDYWFLQYEFPDNNLKPYITNKNEMIFCQELNKNIPATWKVTKLKDFCEFTKGKIPLELFDECKKNFAKYLTIDVVNDGIPKYCDTNDMPICSNNAIMVMDGAASGDVYFVDDGVLGSTFSMVNSKNKKISNALVYLILNRYSDIYKRANTGSTVPHANKNYILNMNICLPINDLEIYSNYFSEIYAKINDLKKENFELINLRNFLTPLFINNQVKGVV